MAENKTKPAEADKQIEDTGATAAEVAALKEQLVVANKRADEEAAKAAAAEERANTSNSEAEHAQGGELAELKAQVAKLLEKVEAGDKRTAQTDADEKADRDAAFAPRVVPGETDEFGKPWNPPAPFKQPRSYRATEKVYVDGVLYEAGDTVVTNQRPSRTLVPITLEEKVAIEASAEQHGDVNLADMSSSELRAWLAAKGVDHGGLKDRQSLLSAALAWNDPTR